MSMTLYHYLLLASILFGMGGAGIVLHRHNLIVLLMCIELMLLAVNTSFIASAHYLNDLSGQIFVFFVLAVAAAEAAIGLAILMVLFRRRGTIDIEKMDLLRG